MNKLTNQSQKRSISVMIGIFTMLLSCLSLTVSCTSLANENKQQTSIPDATAEPAEARHNLGEIAPDFILSDLNGEKLRFSSLRGKMVVMHFATTWCPFCNAEAPYLEQVKQKYQHLGVEVLIVDVKESRELVKEKLQDRFNFSFPVLLDTDGAVASNYAPEGVLPNLSRDEVVLASNLLIDKEGKIQFYSLLDSKNFDAELIALQTRLNELL